MEYKINDKIRIIHMDGEPNYNGKEGIITSIDDANQLHGTWGGCALIPDVDKFIVLMHNSEIFNPNKSPNGKYN